MSRTKVFLMSPQCSEYIIVCLPPVLMSDVFPYLLEKLVVNNFLIDKITNVKLCWLKLKILNDTSIRSVPLNNLEKQTTKHSSVIFLKSNCKHHGLLQIINDYNYVLTPNLGSVILWDDILTK